jgi:hypothetical protein
MRKIALLVMVIISLTKFASAQTGSDSIRIGIIKWAPRIGEYPSFLYEYNRKPGRALEFGAGYISQVYTLDDIFGRLFPGNGFSLRANMNHYAKLNSPCKGFFFGPTLLYRFVDFRVFSGVPIEQYVHNQLHVLEPGFRAGTQFTGRYLSFSIYLGLGLRGKYFNFYNSSTVRPIIVGYEFRTLRSASFLFDPAAHLGLNIGFIFPRS